MFSVTSVGACLLLQRFETYIIYQKPTNQQLLLTIFGIHIHIRQHLHGAAQCIPTTATARLLTIILQLLAAWQGI